MPTECPYLEPPPSVNLLQKLSQDRTFTVKLETLCLNYDATQSTIIREKEGK